ncbi:MAG: hypothetical protein ACJZ4P_01890 [Candidatus Micropelagos sp.]|jgi:hypothetical protein|uniref:Uncharacterized protein n=1 Tax=PS1 clade bacterium TaxID=2175152 RepID=A0A368EKP3_9PROT|nr:MAG: hypothetical protein CBE09_00685 [Rhizobiales bacterium TMED249]RCL75201.1 MAG: hypothetical protein DBW69_06655 [PS1 clade bacterium]RCL85272.1 MAG: hypothetical protein DBW64_01220 [PS1 clade bacterium]HAK99182.1 hypothetical protein [Rhodobiaceae bacterium]HCN31655.1 hypothetical protein [Rhodobiaceae bacterium]|tara:strand:+ start:226 stop:957 length:732 start_codon:yes stop_codon:yes gene_type:complete
MSNKLKLVQEGVKLALDAADAAADVTAEFNKVKSQNIELVNRVSGFYKNSWIIAIFAIFSAFSAFGMSLFLYFGSVSELETLSKTNRQALVVFAENVESVNKTITEAQGVFDRQVEIINANKEMMVAIQSLSEEDKKSREALDALITTNAQSILQTQMKVQKELQSALKTLRVAQERSSKSIEKVVLSSSKSQKGSNNAPVIKSLQEVLLLQQNINKKLVELADSNSKLLKEVRLSSRQIQYP